jgi:serine/threonine protein kinase
MVAVTVVPRTRCGQYEILERLAVGGMAELFLARAPGRSEPVVVKRLLPSLQDHPPYPGMFRKEAQLAATLSHPNIVQVLEVGTDAGNEFIAMEHLQGSSLRTLQAALDRHQRFLPVEHTLRILIGMCAALHYAHEKLGPDGKPLGLVHRDVSPHNVIITHEGDVKLIDFGVAKTADEGEKTALGIVKGKLSYMSPEQCTGRAVDRRSDLYSLGIILFELTTGRRLYYGGTEYETLKRIIEMPVPPPRSIDGSYDPRLEQILMRALAKPRDDRYQTAQEMQLDLVQLAQARGACTSSIELQELLAELVTGGDAPMIPDEDLELLEVGPSAEADGSASVRSASVLSPGPAAPQPLSQLHKRPFPWSRVGMVAAAAAAFVVIALLKPKHAPAPARPAHVEPSPPLAAAPEPPPPEPTLIMPPMEVARMPAVQTPAPRPAPARPSRPLKRIKVASAAPDLRGSLLIDSSPWCLVAVDGVTQGPTPIQVKLAAGNHTVRLRNSRFHIDKSEQVVVAPNQTVRRRVDFPTP